MTETKEKSISLENLNYIGLDLENIPNFLTNYKEPDYNLSISPKQREIKLYRYINLKNIEILLTPINKSCSIAEKYSKAKSLGEYLKNENINLFLEILNKIDINEIKNIEEEQNLAKSRVPFRVELETSNLWDIYYSEVNKKYFMLVSLENGNYNSMCYLLKKQIEAFKSQKEELIYSPIANLPYTQEFLTENEISEIEKYIWLFAKECPRVYEVFDKENNLTLHITGNTSVYDKIQSNYKIELNSKEDAVNFYSFIKSLFILKAELPKYYDFDTQINEKGELTFEINNKLITYNNLSKFIKEEYKKHSEILQKLFEDKEKTDIELDKLKEEELEKDKEYLFKERQISTYLACRRSVLGKIKYFLNSKNGKFSKSKENKFRANKVKEQNDIEKSIANSIIEEKEEYSLDDLIKICIEVDRIKLKIQNAKLDIKALKEKIKIITAKIQNATLFIEKIEEHKKSIFEFWKFSNKDLPLGLNEGLEVETQTGEAEIKEENQDINIYFCDIDKLNLSEAKIFYLNPTDAINSVKEEKVSLSKIKMIAPLELQENEKTIELDISNYKVDLKKQKIFRINYENDKFDFKEKIVCVYEYEAK